MLTQEESKSNTTIILLSVLQRNTKSPQIILTNPKHINFLILKKKKNPAIEFVI